MCECVLHSEREEEEVEVEERVKTHVDVLTIFILCVAFFSERIDSRLSGAAAAAAVAPVVRKGKRPPRPPLSPMILLLFKQHPTLPEKSLVFS